MSVCVFLLGIELPMHVLLLGREVHMSVFILGKEVPIHVFLLGMTYDKVSAIVMISVSRC